MPPKEDPTAEIMNLMDAAGLDGSLLTQKGPFMKGVIDVRVKLAAALKIYIERRDRRVFDAGRQLITDIKETKTDDRQHI